MISQSAIWRPEQGRTERVGVHDRLQYNVDEASEQFPGLEPLTSVSFHSFAPGRNPEPLTLARNVESLELVVRGTAEYQNSFGVHATFPAGTAHLLSAGVGAYQTLFNASGENELHTVRLDFLPGTLNAKPYHATAAVPFEQHANQLVAIAEPASTGSVLPLRQRATLLAGTFAAGFTFAYAINAGVALVAIVMEGEILAQGERLQGRNLFAVLGETTVAFSVERETILAVVEVAKPSSSEPQSSISPQQLMLN